MFHKFMIFIFIALTAVLAGPSPAKAQNEKPVQTITFDGQNWRVAAQKAEIVDHLGRNVLALTGGRLWADDIDFTDGVISFDVAYAEQTIFVGAGWRAQNDGRFEEMYFRGHLNEKPDALQYTPVENGNSAWQIFSDGNAIAPVTQTFTGWNKVKIVVQGDKADIYFNSESPVLHIPDLKTGLTQGAVSLRSSGRQAGPAHFSNVAIRPLGPREGVVGVAKPMPKLPAGVIGQWQISSPFDEAEVKGVLKLEKRPFRQLKWQMLNVETNGIANLARLADRREQGNTVFVRLKLQSDTRQMKMLRFGYSDRVRIYLNGKRVYGGDAGWRVRDYRFLGTVGFFDTVGLDLKAGSNELLVAVSETFGGWAWAGAFEDRTGLVLGKR
ncbi:hypothetical protein [Parasphingorhabdus sp.]|uniref:hypothetical protein n=1 Tax=Parasphingorhabdus sp. TaxID=2709688 RepID=UPI0032640927